MHRAVVYSTSRYSGKLDWSIYASRIRHPGQPQRWSATRVNVRCMVHKHMSWTKGYCSCILIDDCAARCALLRASERS